jgi:pimeloyl-ACP methyl ester carboxylesterase
MSFGAAEPEHLGATALPDGRHLAWAQWGPAGGTPVLFIGGAAMGRSLGFGVDVLEQLNVRLLAVERPGLGASDADSQRTLMDWPRDITEFAAALELPPYAMVGFSQGAPFALACAAAGLPTAVAVASGQDDLLHPSFADLLDPHLAGLLQALAADPAGVEASFGASADAELLWSLTVGLSSEHDLAVYTDPGFAPLFLRSLQEGFEQGPAGYTRDFVLAMSPWPFDLGAIQVPVDLWYGGHDTSTVHSPDFGATLARRIPTARRWFLADAGSSLLWTHAEPILTSLLQRGRY